ncbi:MAG: WxL domain-containing protein [Lactobacillus sp.]|nr:WxL domain-containing protein [Lactobacillus sp.]
MKHSKIGLILTGLLAGLLIAPGVANAAATEGGTGPGDATYNLKANTAVTPGGNYFAASTAETASAKSTAQFTITAGTLQLFAVPDLNFGAVPMSTLLNGGTQQLKDSNVATGDAASSKDREAFDGNNKGLLAIKDMRGATTGWKLSAAMNPTFKDQKGAPDLTNIALNLKADGKNSVNTTEALPLAGTNIGATATNVATATGTTGKGDTSWNLTDPTNANLTIPKQAANIPSTATYQSTITWTLAVGA